MKRPSIVLRPKWQPHWAVLASLLLLWLAPLSILAQQPTPEEAELAEAYYLNGEYEAALELFDKLLKHEPTSQTYLDRALACLKNLGQSERALQLMEWAIEENPSRPTYRARLGFLHYEQNDSLTAASVWEKLLSKGLGYVQDYSQVGAFFFQNKVYDWAARTYLQAREKFELPELYAVEMANVYLAQGEPGKASTELLAVYLANRSQLAGVRTQIVRLTNENSKRAIQRTLLQAIGRKPGDLGLQEILYEVYLKGEDFEEALVQARSLDRLMGENGLRLYQLAKTFQNNRQYLLSNKALEYIINGYKNSPYYLQAYYERARNFELQAFEQQPLDSTAIYEAVNNYDALFEQFGRRDAFYNAMYQKARLCVFYLNDLPTAKAELDYIQRLQVSPQALAQSYLLYGDIHLIEGDYNKAKLRYLEVQRLFAEGQLGAEARYREARLNYFKGEFELAQSQLRVLKDNSANDIANNAIELFLLMQDNLGLDSTEAAMLSFAQAQLLVYQRQDGPAEEILDSLLYAIGSHPLVDEVYWEKAQLELRRNNISQALFFLDKILETHPRDVLADDALFKKAELYQYQLDNPEIARSLYLKILTDYPASLYKVEARKRIRQLRGDEL